MIPMEIEIKIKTDNLEEIKNKLIEMGTSFDGTVTQIDDYYKPKGREMETQRPGSFILRIRKQGDQYSFTLKGLTEITGAWLEYETKINNPDDLERILEKIGFTKIFTITKERIRGNLDEFEVCVDRVKELGNYVEFEVISDNPEEGKQKILKLFEKLDVSEEQIEHRGYAAIISQNMGVKFEGTNG